MRLLHPVLVPYCYSTVKWRYWLFCFVCVRCPLMQDLFGLEAWTMLRPSDLVKFNFLLEEWGSKDQTVDHLVIVSLIPCHEPSLPEAEAVRWRHMNGYIYLTFLYPFISLSSIWFTFSLEPFLVFFSRDQITLRACLYPPSCSQ